MNHALRWATRLALFLTALFVLGTGVAGAQESDGIAVDLPIGVCGVGVGLLGDQGADCADAPPAEAPEPAEPAGSAPSEASASTGEGTLLGDVDADVDTPIRVCGIGLGATRADCGEVASTEAGDPAAATPPPAPTAADSSELVPGVIGDVDADVDAPVSLCGIGVGVLGAAGADCTTTSATAPEDPTVGSEGPAIGPVGGLVGGLPSGLLDGELVGGPPGGELLGGLVDLDALDGALAGPLTGDVDAEAAAPISVCGIGVGVAGDSTSDCSARVAGASVEPPATGTPGDPGTQPGASPVVPDGSGTSLTDGLPLGLPIGIVDALGGLDGLDGLGGPTGALAALATPSAVPVLDLLRAVLAATGPDTEVLTLLGVAMAFLLSGLLLRRGATALV